MSLTDMDAMNMKTFRGKPMLKRIVNHIPIINADVGSAKISLTEELFMAKSAANDYKS